MKKKSKVNVFKPIKRVNSSQLINKEKSLTEKKTPIWQDWRIFSLGCLGVGILGYSSYVEISTPNIIHLKMDDFSTSGIEKLTPQRKEHCLAILENLNTGDKVIEAHFAERAEKISSKSVSNPMTDNICSVEDNLNSTDADIGKIEGTSLRKALEMAFTLIENERNSGNSNVVVLSMTLDATETVKGQAPEDFTQIQSLLNDIVETKAVVRIMGVQGELQNKLQSITSSQPYVDICTLAEVRSCVQGAFEQSRKFKPITVAKN